MAFMTERETEEWLTLETRPIPMPNGAARPYTAMKVFWGAWDFLLIWKLYTAEKLIDLAERNSKAKGYSFEQSLEAIVAYASNDARKKLGFD